MKGLDDLRTIRFEPQGRVGLPTLDRPEGFDAVSRRTVGGRPS